MVDFINDIIYNITRWFNKWKLNRIESEYRIIQEDYTGSTRVEFKMMDGVEYIIDIKRITRPPNHPSCRGEIIIK